MYVGFRPGIKQNGLRLLSLRILSRNVHGEANETKQAEKQITGEKDFEVLHFIFGSPTISTLLKQIEIQGFADLPRGKGAIFVINVKRESESSLRRFGI